MKLFLTSKGVTENLAQDFLTLVGKEPQKVKLYFVPTATDVEEQKTYMVASMEDFAALGINLVWYSLQFKTKNIIERELADADVIWVGGGNTFYLLDVARKTGFMDVVDDLVRNKGVLYGGTSAGTILANPSIEVAGWGEADRNDVGLRDLTSFGFLNALTHVHAKPEDTAMLSSHKGDLPIYTLPDGGALMVDGERMTLLGDAKLMP